jgi:hypothetical protein
MNQPHVIGVISDTHGLLRPEVVVALQGSELIIHAGDVGGIRLTNHVRTRQLIPHREESTGLRQPHTFPGYALDNLW